jgi:hypothetical protein
MFSIQKLYNGLSLENEIDFMLYGWIELKDTHA